MDREQGDFVLKGQGKAPVGAVDGGRALANGRTRGAQRWISPRKEGNWLENTDTSSTSGVSIR